ncbi:MAG: hypothetical protein WDZ83_15840 [Rhizobiaceae bacterium]
MNRFLFRGLALALLAMLVAACQSAGPEDVLGLDPNTPIPTQETTGTGPVSITLLLPRTGDRGAALVARDVHDGARLAVNELGAGAVRLVTFDTTGKADTARSQAEQAIATGTKLILTGLDGASTPAVAGIASANRPVVIDLASAPPAGKGTYAFASDAISSALEGVRTAIGAKQSRVVVAAPENMAAADIDRLKRGIAAHGGTLTGVVSYPPAESAIAAALARSRAAFEKAQTMVLFGSGKAPVVVARAVAAGGYGNNITTLIGNSSWPPELFTDPVFDGVLIAMIDQQSLKELGDRYSAATGRPLSLEAAYAYDAVALAAGLVRSAGNDAITKAALGSKAGFRGTTGIFRFDANGNAERRHRIYRIESGKAQPLGDQPQTF